METPGWHDLFVVAFRESDQRPTDSRERLPPAFGVGGRRTVVCAGACTAPSQLLPEAVAGQGTGVHDSHAYAFPLFPDGANSPKKRLLLSTSGNPEETVALELWVRTPSDQSRDCVVVPLLDFKQTDLVDSSILHLHIPPGSG